MDKNVLRERQRRKQQQLRRRAMIQKLAAGVVCLLILIAFVRLVILPVGNRLFSGGKKKEDEEIVTTQAADPVDPNAAVRKPLKGIGDLEKILARTPGWHTDSGGRWYQNPDGTYYSAGFQSVDGVQYYFQEDGHAATGWVTVGAVDYFFNDDGSYNPDKVRPMLCLTFDDGPGQYTSRLLDCLEENGAHATFFMLGELIGYYPEEVNRMLEIGCELGNHSYDHSQLTSMSIDDAVKQFDITDQELMKVCGKKATVARAPYGAYTDEIIEAVGKPFFMWSLDSLDWSYKDVNLDYNEIMNGDLTDGTIILMHDIHEPSVECACLIIPELINMGYRLVTVSEMAEAKNVVLQDASYSDFWKDSLESGVVPGYQGRRFEDTTYSVGGDEGETDDTDESGSSEEDNFSDGSEEGSFSDGSEEDAFGDGSGEENSSSQEEDSSSGESGEEDSYEDYE